MALIVETGSGSSTAESYLSVTDADTYHSNYGNTDWTGDDSVKEIALRKATRYIDALYARRWLGRRVSASQALDWPRAYVEDYDGFYLSSSEIPQGIKDAIALMALAALTEDIYPDLDEGEGAKVASKIVVGPIEISDQFAGGAVAVKYYRLAEDLLSRYITSGGTISRG